MTITDKKLFLRFEVEMFRWSNISSLIKNYCLVSNINIEMKQTNFIIKKHYFCRAKGTEQQLLNLKDFILTL